MTQTSKRILFNSRINGVFEDEKLFDFYPTPKWGIELMLDNLELPKKCNVLEPCNGLSSISNVFRERGFSVKRMDINPDAEADIYGDFLTHEFNEEFNVICTNPPYKFNKNNEFEEKAISIVKDNGYVIFLGQITKLESLRRKIFYDKYPLHTVLVHSRRYKIYGKSGIGYAWFVWKKGYKGKTELKII